MHISKKEILEGFLEEKKNLTACFCIEFSLFII